jgi:putative transposase
VSVADLCRKHGVSDASIYNWKARFGGMDVSEARRLKSLEDENTRLNGFWRTPCSTMPR